MVVESAAEPNLLPTRGIQVRGRRILSRGPASLDWYSLFESEDCLAKVTLFFAALLIALGLAGYIGTGSLHPTALIPAWIGLILGLCGWLAMSPDEKRRKLFMHINVTIALLGFIGSAAEAVRGYVHAQSAGTQPDAIALASKIALAGLLLLYVILCVRSFVAARRSGRV